MALVTARNRVLDDHHVEAALCRVGRRQSHAAIDESAGESQAVDPVRAQLLLEVGPEKRAVARFGTKRADGGMSRPYFSIRRDQVLRSAL